MSGYLSVRVGKEEYLVSAQEAFWLPLECLTALTYFPNSQILEIDIFRTITQSLFSSSWLCQPFTANVRPA